MTVKTPHPAWIEHAIWWHVYPLGFVGAPIRTVDTSGPHHRLRHLIDWLDYAIELGASGLLLGPVFTSSTHGYDTLDFFSIDPRLGDESDFAALIDSCRERGLRVVLDGVFSHVSRDHRAARERSRELVDLDESGEPRVFEGHGHLARLNHSSPEVAELTVKVMRHWLDRGADGWRLDAAYSVPPEFWNRTLRAVRATHPKAWFLAEVIHGDYGQFAAESTVDAITQYELWKALWSSINDRNFFELDWNLQRHEQFAEQTTMQTFMGNHDVTRIATQIGSSAVPVVLAVIATVSGVPSIYAGDEQGYTGQKTEREGGDDAIRPAFPDHPEGLSNLGADILQVHKELIGLRRRNPWLVTSHHETLELESTRYRYAALGREGQRLEVCLDITDGFCAQISSEDLVQWRYGSIIPG